MLALKREILRLRSFHILEVPGEGSEKDGSILLKCSLGRNYKKLCTCVI